MDRCFTSRDVSYQVLSFLHLDDWYHCHILNKRISQYTSRLRSFIERCILSRLHNFLSRSLPDIDLHLFYVALAETNAFISGSIFIELLLGSDVFKAGDIDIFMPFTCEYTVLHRLLWQCATHIPSIRGHKLTSEEKVQTLRRVHVTEEPANFHILPNPGTAIEFHRRGPRYEHELIVDHVTTVCGILAITEYEVEPATTRPLAKEEVLVKFQVVELSSNHMRGHNLVKHHIDEGFDFQCIQGFFGGTMSKPIFQLPNLGDILHRRLVISERRKRYMVFMKPSAVNNYLERRVAKYEERGFRLQESLSWAGKYFNQLDTLSLELRHRKYTVDHLTRLCESGQRKRTKPTLYAPPANDKRSTKRVKKTERKNNDHLA